MPQGRLDNRVREARERVGVSQSELARRLGVSRQALVAIEAGRQVPSTVLGLRIARALRTSVEEVFLLQGGEGIGVRVAPPSAELARGSAGRRVALGEVDGGWVAHRLPADATLAADGVLESEGSNWTGLVRPLSEEHRLRRNVLVAGCAPLLGALARRIRDQSPDARATWLDTGSGRSLELLRAGLVHVAGVHGGGSPSGEDNATLGRQALQGRKVVLVNLTSWRLGIVVPAGNPLRIRSGGDLFRPGLEVARREAGTGAQKLVQSLAAAEGVEGANLLGPLATGHDEVAQLVRCGAADAGVAIEAVALAAGLGFVPLVEERFDLLVPASLADETPVCRLIETLDDPAFRADAGEIPGYDTASCGHATTLEAA
ncbi:MAG: helix-turn-helix domain-containing protein [Gemmatimonadetes bacterium]|nr:helix-turn-helix domain-containing protein [Gemmatimonadota bacterium]